MSTETINQIPEPLVAHEDFKAPTLLFPRDRPAAPVTQIRKPWGEVGTAIQDKYLTKAYWLIKQGHVLHRDAEELAQMIYYNNPSMFVM